MSDERGLKAEITSRFCDSLIGALPDPAMVIGDDLCVAAANALARQLLPALRTGEPTSGLLFERQDGQGLWVGALANSANVR